jgi:hypothetical protein
MHLSAHEARDLHVSEVIVIGIISRPRLGFSPVLGSASGTYQITQLLAPEGDEYQYRIKSVREPHERIVKEPELRSAA